MRGEAERAFLEFRDTRRPAAVARVFDLVAGELSLVAGHLTRNPVEAEDLLQGTFAEAMEKRERWDSSRPLLPWLLGILLNLHRVERRRRRTVRAVETSVARSLDDPVRAAEGAELALALSSALASIPATYRDSLNLRLVHGLEPVQIAHALGRPLETVKTQLRRGKQLLREALPKGVAGWIAFEPDGLAKVRGLVLAHAEGLAAGPTLVGATWGAIVMTKKLMISTLVLLVGAGSWWWLDARDADPPRPAAVQRSVGPTAEMLPAVTPIEDLQSPATAPPRRGDARSTPQPLPASLACRVVWDEDGSPAAGIRLELRHSAASEFRERPRATSDAEGLALIGALAPGRARLSADRGGLVELVLERGANEVELRIPLGLIVSGVVLDEREEPVPDAELWIASRRNDSDTGQWVGHAREDGSFSLRSIEPDRVLSARAPGHTAALGVQVRGAPGDHVIANLLLGSAGYRVSGIVRGSDGEPISGALVMLGYMRGPSNMLRGALAAGHPINLVHTDEKGLFEADGVGRNQPVWAIAEGFSVWHEDVLFSEPETWIEIELQRPASIEGIVRQEDGSPASDVSVQAYQPGIDNRPGMVYAGPTWGPARTYTAADGSFLLPRVRPGPVTLYARDYDDRRETSLSLELDAGQRFTWDPVLGDGREIQGVIRDEEGNPLEGLEVYASAQAETRHSLETVSTDRQGAFRLEHAVRDEYQLRIQDPRADLHTPLIVDGVEPGGAPLELVFPTSSLPSARLVAHLHNPDGSPYVTEWITFDRTGRGSPWETGGGKTSCTEGRLETGLLPPGRYILGVSNEASGFWQIGTYYLAAGQVLDIGRQVCPAAGSIAIEVFCADGQPLVSASISVIREGSPMGDSITLRSGRGTSRPLQPGAYWVGFSGFRQPLLRRRVEVHSDETTQVNIALPTAVARLVQLPLFPVEGNFVCKLVWLRDGEVQSQATVLLSNRAAPYPLMMQLVPGRYEVEVTLDDGQSATTRFEVTAEAESDAVIVLRSPLGE